MKKLLIGLGIFLLILTIGVSVLFFLQHTNSKNEKIIEPKAPPTPEYKPSNSMTKNSIDQENAQIQRNYDRDLEVYRQNMITYQEESKAKNNQTNSYLVYMVILDSILLVLAFVSILIAFMAGRSEKPDTVSREEATPPSA